MVNIDFCVFCRLSCQTVFYGHPFSFFSRQLPKFIKEGKKFFLPFNCQFSFWTSLLPYFKIAKCLNFLTSFVEDTLIKLPFFILKKSSLSNDLVHCATARNHKAFFSFHLPFFILRCSDFVLFPLFITFFPGLASLVPKGVSRLCKCLYICNFCNFECYK